MGTPIGYNTFTIEYIEHEETRMERIQTVKIQEWDGVEMYTAHIRKSGDRWIGQIKEVPVVQCEGRLQ